MSKGLEKFLVNLIYFCIGATLVVPLFVSSSFFFPFVFSKALMFRVIVEIMLLAYLLLLWKSNKYAPSFNLISWLLIGFIGIAAITSAIGISFSVSFWSTIERSEGLLWLLHLLVYFIILGGILKNKQHWLGFFDFSIGVTIIMGLFALGQALGLESFLSPGGSRVTATMGNAAFFAAYLLFHINLAAYLFSERREWGFRLYYFLTILLFVYLLIQTEVRGAVLGFGVAMFIVMLLVCLDKNIKAKIRLASLGGLALVILLAVGLYLVRDQAWVGNYPALKRLASISLEETTAQTRLVTWQAAWEGIKERPLTGFGAEHFGIVFDKHFPPTIYQDEGSAVWFDRAHNFVFDKATTSGILGLLFYIAFLVAPLYVVWRVRKAQIGNPVIFYVGVSLVVAYLVQNLFVFESVAVYIILMFVWAWWAWLLNQQDGTKFSFKKEFYHPLVFKVLALVWAVAFIPSMIWVNIQPAQANLLASQASKLSNQTETFFQTVALFSKALGYQTYGVSEYQIEFIDYVSFQLAPVGEVSEAVKEVLKYTEDQADKLISAQPYDTKSNLVAMRLYNYTYRAIVGEETNRLKKALSYFEKLKVISPTREHIYQEAGYSYLYLARLASSQGLAEERDEALKMSVENFQIAIDLNPLVVESHLNLLALHLEFGSADQLSKAYQALKESRAVYLRDHYMDRLTNTAAQHKNFAFSAEVSKEFTELEPDNINAWIQLALSYAHSGNRAEAKKVAEYIAITWPAEAPAVEDFLEQIDQGAFDPK